MQKCSHKIPLTQNCPSCDELAKAKGLDEESQSRRAYDDWAKETEIRAREAGWNRLKG